LAKYAGVNSKDILNVFRIIDKLDKVSVKEVKKQLLEIISEDAAEKILDFIKIKGKNDAVLKKASKIIDNEGINELKEILSYIKDDSKVKIDLSLARGLDYYTGPIFEVFVEEGLGSVAAGGRYDKLIGLFLKRDVPATGISFGVDRLIEVMKKKKIDSSVKVFVAPVNDKVRAKSLDIVQLLRKKSIPTDYDLRSRKLSKQLEYVSNMKIPFVAIVGEKELKKKSVKLRNMKTGKEEMIKISQLAKRLAA
jgi:histidyl-tRNA synthetase